MDSTSHQPLILLVDDTLTNLLLLVKVLKKSYRLKTATSGADALRLAHASDKPDLILLDIMMPCIDGYETCRQLKADPQTQTIPVIFITALTDSDNESAGLALGAADYITKPIHIDITKHRIVNLLERECLRKEVEAYRDTLEELVKIRTQALILAQNQTIALQEIAYYDPLTGVPNRRLLMDRLNQAIANTKRLGQLLAIGYFDLDGFKLVNDQWGHDAGDQLLIEVTARVQKILRECDTLARIGGDEFALLLGGIEQDKEYCGILERILATIRKPFTINNQFISVSASIGVTFYPLDDVTPDNLLNHADAAMYQAKQLGKDRFVSYINN